ncbi:sigma-54-dependent Fis family transcriptional regulator [Zhongshania marina]|uniref:Sigma-54-dependent Fis family transcriptional regulator n=1 Tax=Zhongshania marina TaxID=2304603 RepID=A0A2S4HIC6_9GAMM|nr:sigma-54-dependent Fis family transcriptional regulator [Marortus luteolus]
MVNNHKLSPRFLIAAPVEQSLRLQHVLLSLGECRVYTNLTDLKPAECDAIFSSGQFSPALKKWLGAATPPVVTLSDTSTSQANPVNGLVLKTDFYYQDVLEVLYRLQLGRERGAVLANEPLVGVSSAVAELRRLSAQVADKAVTVLITGPSGAGKEVVARSLHDLSSRRDAPFVPINCGAIPRELLESELFGHERGAFTGAISSRAGRFELAEGGTLFLDEIGDMPLEMQVKILRVIQERQFERVGSDKTRTADVRIIAATHRNLEAMISAGQFREDLYYRINVFPLNVPALAERREDIPHLIRVLSKQLEAEGLGRLRLADSALRSLSAHAWSGNIRELANLLERLVIMYPDTVVGFADLPENYRHGGDSWRPASQSAVDTAVRADGVPSLPVSGIDMKAYFQILERQWIAEALEAHAGVISKAATHLGLRRTTLIEKMRKLDIKV